MMQIVEVHRHAEGSKPSAVQPASPIEHPTPSHILLAAKHGRHTPQYSALCSSYLFAARIQHTPCSGIAIEIRRGRTRDISQHCVNATMLYSVMRALQQRFSLAAGIVVAARSGPSRLPTIVVARAGAGALEWHSLEGADSSNPVIEASLGPEQEAYKVLQVLPGRKADIAEPSAT